NSGLLRSPAGASGPPFPGLTPVVGATTEVRSSPGAVVAVPDGVGLVVPVPGEVLWPLVPGAVVPGGGVSGPVVPGALVDGAAEAAGGATVLVRAVGAHASDAAATAAAVRRRVRVTPYGRVVRVVM